MDYYVDWNCQLAPCIRGSIAFPQVTVSALKDLVERFQMTHFCMMPDFDYTKESAAMFLLRRDRSECMLREILPKEIQVKYSARVHLLPGLHKEYLDKLLLTKEHYLPLVLPLADYADWIDKELNSLLYHSPYKKLLFTSCDVYSFLYPKEEMDKLFRIKNAVFQFHYQSLTEPHIRQVILNLIDRKQTVLLGTSLNTPGKVWQFDLEYYQKSATETLSVADRYRLMRMNRLFWDK